MNDDDLFVQLARRIVSGGRLRRRWPLEGGVSATMHAMEISTPDRQVRRVVVRRHEMSDLKTIAQDVAAMEFALLGALRRLGVAVPEPYLFDDSKEVFPTPYYVMEFVNGTTAVNDAELPDALRRMAEFLAHLHALDIEAADLPALPEREDPREGVMEYPPPIALADRILAHVADQGVADPTNPPSLLHGDFWPGNILWHHGRIAAVLDWEDAALGDPVSDLACARVELLCRHDEAAMESFTAHYGSLAELDLANLPLWEVYVSSAALASMAQWGLDPEVETERRRRTLCFLERAGRELLSAAG